MDATMKEGWAEWAVGMAYIALRIFARYSAVGWKWAGDDYLVILAGVRMALSVA